MVKVKLFVYYDEKYPTNWLSDKVAKQIVSFLEKRNFEVIDASNLRRVLTEYAGKPHSEEAVVVFARDVLPDLVLDNPANPSANSPLRRYLNAGHTVVWLGDIPLYYVGSSDGTKRNLPSNACQIVLGINPAQHLGSYHRVKLTQYGLMYGLPVWAGRRPHPPGATMAGIEIIPLALSRHGNQVLYHGFIASYARSSFSGFIRIYDFVMDKPIAQEYLEALHAIAVMRSPITYLLDKIRELSERLETKFNTLKSEVDSLAEYLKRTYGQTESKH